MWNRKNGIVVVSICLLTAGLINFAGCEKNSMPEVSDLIPLRENGIPPAGNVDDWVAVQPIEPRMVGTWLGEAYIDMARLEEKVQRLPAERKAVVLNFVDEFLTTAMAVDFRADGSLEQELELTPLGGQPLRDGGTGNWQVVQSNTEQALIETKTKLTDGTIVTDKQLYRFYSDANQLAQVVDLGEEIAGCGALIVLRRQQLPDNNLAEQTDGAQVR